MGFNLQKETNHNTNKMNHKCQNSSFYIKLEKSLGFHLEDLTSYSRFCKLMFRPADPSGLAVVRILFGFLMMVDILEERGLSQADLKWGNPHNCHFPLFEFLRPLPLEWMCVLYFIMWIGATGMMVGAYFRVSCLCFSIPYWYLFLLDKSAWNNHSYLYGLLALLFLFSCANHCWSIDGLLNRAPKNGHVPLWNYAVLRFQVFILYFIAGLKKLDQDWLSGYSMNNLASHWLFDPFKLVLSQEQIDYWIVHFFGFILDLTVGFFMYFDKTRPTALLFLAFFHIMNSRIFQIGMFPYVCLATMPLFCHTNWPRKLLISFNKSRSHVKLTQTNVCIYPPKLGAKQTKVKADSDVRWNHRLTCALLLSYAALQGFLPYSHFLTQGYNNWTNGLYGYSWDMMVHTWETVLVVVKVVDRDTGEEHYLNPQAWTYTERYSKHGDMVYQYAHCLKDNIQRGHPSVRNLAVHMDVWCSLNRRFQQRMFDPRVNLLEVSWSPFWPMTWLMPLLTEFNHWRQWTTQLEKQVYSWSNHTDVLFVADFPGLHLENYIHEDLVNVSLGVLEGEVVVEFESGANQTIGPGENTQIPTRKFHKVYTVSPTPSCYMYTYSNQTLLKTDTENSLEKPANQTNFAFLQEIRHRWNNFIQCVRLVKNALLKIIFSVPMNIRVKQY